MESLETLVAGGLPLLGLVFGVVEFAKKLGLKGNWLTVFSMVLGVLFGVGVELGKMYPVVGKWYGVAAVGLGVGLAASGVYDFVNKRFPAVK
jgi:hypothetical protein